MQGRDVVVKPTKMGMEPLAVNPVSVEIMPMIAQSIVLGFELRVFRKERLVLGGEFRVRHGRLAPSGSSSATNYHALSIRRIGCRALICVLA